MKAICFISFHYDVRRGNVFEKGFSNTVETVQLENVGDLEDLQNRLQEDFRERVQADSASLVIFSITPILQ